MNWQESMKKLTSTNLGTINTDGIISKNELPKDLYQKKRKQDLIRFLIILFLSHLGAYLLYSSLESPVDQAEIRDVPGTLPIAVSLINKSGKDIGEVSLIYQGQIVVQKATLLKKEKENENSHFASENSETWIISVSERELSKFIQRSQIVWEAYPPISNLNTDKKEGAHEIRF